MAQVHELSDLKKSDTAALFEGSKYGDGMALSFFVTAHPPGVKVPLHVHPYAEAFVVYEGEATFAVDAESVVATAGQVVVVPPETAHGFENTGETTLRIHSMHPSPEVQQTWL